MSNQKPPWYKERGYLHFDRPINAAQALPVISSSVRVAAHSFYPFISTTLTSYKWTRNTQTGQLERKKKDRPIRYAAHLDSHIYAYYAYSLGQLYESLLNKLGLSDTVLAFRPLGKSNIEFALRAFSDIQARKACEVVAVDIEGFFDNLDHSLLKSQWCRLLGVDRLPGDHFKLYRSLTRHCSVDKKALFETLGISEHNPKKDGRYRLCSAEQFRSLIRDAKLLSVNEDDAGIPQGSPMSAVLSNIYMLPFDEAMAQYAASVNGLYMRYCDDVIVISSGQAPHSALDTLRKCIADVKLTVQEDKTEERQFTYNGSRSTSDKPIQYLGFIFDGKNIRIRESSVARYLERMRRGVAVALNCLSKRNRSRLRLNRTPKPLYLKKLVKRYSYIGRRNFVSYGYRSSRIMSSNSIRRQLKPLWIRLLRAIDPPS